jgi:hypothetical protein
MVTSLRIAIAALAVVGLSIPLSAQINPGSIPGGLRPDLLPKRKSNPPPQKTDPTDPAAIPAGEAWAEKVLAKGRDQEWLATVEVALGTVNDQDANGLPTTRPLKFDTAVIIFPIIESTGSSRTFPDNFKSRVSFDGSEVDGQPTFITGYPSGARFARWEARQKDANGMRLRVEMGIGAASTRLDETLAMQIPWPTGAWPEVAASTFKPQMFIDYVVNEQEKTASSIEFAKQVKAWMKDEDPKKLPPVRVAKMLLGSVVESIQPSGDGLSFNRTGAFRGFNLKGALQTLKDGKGSEHDMACVLVAAYRAAGLPARIVIGLDVGNEGLRRNSNSSGQRRLYSIVEFCLIDPGTKKEIWIPVDPVRLRKTSSRPPGIDREWRFFGTHSELSTFIPLSYHYHPPTTVVAHGSPCLWGWITTPNILAADQTVKFNVSTRPRRSSDNKPATK